MTIIGMIYFYTIFLLWTYVDMITTDIKAGNGNSEKFISGLDMLTQKYGISQYDPWLITYLET